LDRELRAGLLRAVTCSTQLGADTFRQRPAAGLGRSLTASGVGDASLPGGSVRLEAKPNPARRQVRFQIAPGPGAASVELRIFDAAGRCVRTLTSPRTSGSPSLVWNGRDEHGRPMPGGVYFCRAGGQRDAVDLVLLR